MKMKLWMLSFWMINTFVVLSKNNKISKDEVLFHNGLALQKLVNNELQLNRLNDYDSIIIIKCISTNIKRTILTKSLDNYQELVDKYPKSKYLYRALNNKGFIELELGDRKNSKNSFLRILNSLANDKENGGTGSGIMGEPFANYKNRAAKTLAKIAILDSDYIGALKYLELTNKYKYKHFCGNEIAEDKLNIIALYGKCYSGLKEYQKADSVLMPYINGNGLAQNEELVETLFQLLLKKYTKSELKIKFDFALEHYYSEMKKYNEDNSEIKLFYIDFLDHKIQLLTWRLMFAEEDKLKEDKIKSIIKEVYTKSYFYNLINN